MTAEWEPIATAPKDGTKVALYNEHTKVGDIGFWCDYSSRGYESQSGEWGEWSQEEGNGEMTHWREMEPGDDGELINEKEA